MSVRIHLGNSTGFLPASPDGPCAQNIGELRWILIGLCQQSRGRFKNRGATYQPPRVTLPSREAAAI